MAWSLRQPLYLVLVIAYCCGLGSYGSKEQLGNPGDQNLASSFAGRTGVQERVILEASTQNLTQCVWDGVQCGLQSSFVASLPQRLGNASTSSAKVLARSALRAALCSNLTSQPACVAQAAAQGCSWDALRSACVLGDLLDVEALRGVAFCPGSRLDAAASCAALSAQPDVASACAASALNCTTLSGSQALGALGATRRLQPLRPGDALTAGGGLAGGGAAGSALSGLGGLLGRLWESLASGAAASWAASLNVTLPANLTAALNATSLNATAASLAPAADQVAANATAAMNATTVCVAAWTTDRAFLGSLAGDILKAIVSGQPPLSALVTPALFGDCNVTTRLASAAGSCPAAPSRSACDALAGCEWLDAAKACAMGSRLIEEAVLQPADSWVALMSNATAVCRSSLNATSCAAANSTDAPQLPQLPDASTLLANVSDALRLATQNAAAGGGGGGSGGAGATATVSVWAVLGGLAAAAVLPRLLLPH